MNTRPKRQSSSKFASGERPSKLARDDTVPIMKMKNFGSKTAAPANPKSKGDFKTFHSDILQKYVEWMKQEHDVSIKVDENPEKPEVGGLLSGQADATVESDVGDWPLMIKTVYQSPNATPKDVSDIMHGRGSTYLAQDNEGGWYVSKESSVWEACQNVMALHKASLMYLIVYNPRNMDFLVVEVQFEKEAYCTSLAKLNAFLSANIVHM